MKIFGIVTVAGFLGVAAIAGASWYSAAKLGNRLENSVIAQYDVSRNTLAQMGLKIAEAAQVPAMYRDDVAAVATATIEGRYGAEGSKALFQMLTEQNPTLDPTVYIQLQQMIESSRNDFKTTQDKFTDVKRTYNVALGSPWQGFWMGVAGYPKIDLTKYEIVTSVRAEAIFDSGVEEPMVLR